MGPVITLADGRKELKCHPLLEANALRDSEIKWKKSLSASSLPGMPRVSAPTGKEKEMSKRNLIGLLKGRCLTPTLHRET